MGQVARRPAPSAPGDWLTQLRTPPPAVQKKCSSAPKRLRALAVRVMHVWPRSRREKENRRRWLSLCLGCALRQGIRWVERQRTYEPMLSQLARVTDISQMQIEIQNDARSAETHAARTLVPRTSTCLLRRFGMEPARNRGARSPRDFRQRFQEDNAMLREVTSMDSVQRSWIATASTSPMCRPGKTLVRFVARSIDSTAVHARTT